MRQNRDGAQALHCKADGCSEFRNGEGVQTLLHGSGTWRLGAYQSCRGYKIPPKRGKNGGVGGGGEGGLESPHHITVRHRGHRASHHNGVPRIEGALLTLLAGAIARPIWQRQYTNTTKAEQR